MDAVAGFTVGNDVSARDWQMNKGGGQWYVSLRFLSHQRYEAAYSVFRLCGKTFDTFAPIGPAIRLYQKGDTTFDPQNTGIRCFINDKKVQDSNTRQFIFKLDFLISYISSIMTLKPGDLIFTGTPPGVGFKRTPPLFLQPGDTVVCEVDGIGRLTNRVGEASHTARL